MNGYHQTRFEHDERRQTLWKTLCASHFQHMVAPTDAVLELGCGYGDFINNIRCGTKTAVDIWPGAAKYASPDVRLQIGSITSLRGVPDQSVDFVFASNVFEHLTQTDFSACLQEVKRVLRAGGSLNILQPNYRFCYDEYFDDYTHVSIYSDRSLCDLLRANAFQIIECKSRFLPLTIKSRLPVWPALIRFYLASPVKPLAKQMFIRAVLEPAVPGDAAGAE
jgi:ubiquinone/menaquinone biosynthesis C-methylase UbiE